MVVTIQRYILILKSSANEENSLFTVDKLRCFSFLGFWICFVLAILVATITYRVLMNLFDITSLTYRGMPFQTLTVAYISYVLVTSIPDVVSFAFYINLLKVSDHTYSGS